MITTMLFSWPGYQSPVQVWRDFASCLWHDFLNQMVRGMTTNIVHVKFIDGRQDFVWQGEVSPAVWDMTSSTRYEPENSRDDHKFSREVHWLPARLRQGKISPVSYLWRDFFDQSVRGMTTNVFHVLFTDYRQDFARARFRQLFVTWLPRPEASRDDHKCFPREVYWLPATLC